MLSLGSFPEVSLADARGKRDEAPALLANGINPSDQKKQDKLIAEVAGRNTFGAIAEEYPQRLEGSGVTPVTLSKNPWLLLDLASPLAKRPIGKITPLEILVLLQKHEKAGRRETAALAPRPVTPSRPLVQRGMAARLDAMVTTGK